MTPARLSLAAEHLRDTADALRESETVCGTWPDRTGSERRAHAEHDEMMELAAELDAIAAPITEAVPADPMTDAQRRDRRMV